MDRSLLPKPDDVLVTRENNEWVLTCYVNDQTEIRLRIQHTNRMDRTMQSVRSAKAAINYSEKSDDWTSHLSIWTLPGTRSPI